MKKVLVQRGIDRLSYIKLKKDPLIVLGPQTPSCVILGSRVVENQHNRPLKGKKREEMVQRVDCHRREFPLFNVY